MKSNLEEKANSQHKSNERANLRSNNQKAGKKDDNDEGDEIVAFNKSVPIRGKLKEYAGDFD